MKIEIKELPKSQIEILVEISSEKFDEFIDKAIFNLGKDIQIEGFRKGNVPKEILKEKISQKELLNEAAELAVKESYFQIISENKIEAVGRPEIQIMKLAKGNPLEFKIRVSVMPKIELPDYKKIASEIQTKKIFVEDKEIEREIAFLQKSRAKFTLSNQPAQKGDFIEIEFFPQTETEKKQKDNFFLGEGQFIPVFEANLEGMKINEEKEFPVIFPENHYEKNLAGKEIIFRVKINNIQKVELPEINDEFVRNLGKFQNLEDLRKNIREGIFLEKRNWEIQRVCGEILEQIGKRSFFEIPEILLIEEEKRLEENLKNEIYRDLKLSFEDYLKQINKTENEILKTFSLLAEKNIRNFLFLKEIAKKENIKVFPEEIQEEVNHILEHHNNDVKKLDLERLKMYTEEKIQQAKTFQFLAGLVINDL